MRPRNFNERWVEVYTITTEDGEEISRHDLHQKLGTFLSVVNSNGKIFHVDWFDGKEHMGSFGSWEDYKEAFEAYLMGGQACQVK